MTFQQLQIGAYFRIPGISFGCVYRKASNSSCSLNSLLQPIRPSTKVVPLNRAQIAKYIAQKQEFWKSLHE
ncbi:hypothetical protein [Calothrix sp. NIES-2098]|uniref:hypothetical protein n=1 Tax=Calothrix sp. NIES-2098 TaxID=1954171 RepID=UPI000B5FDD8E|nr:hypothetical protein NIES2098_41140 [Calothrix sp. NIES-2098]